MKNPKLNVTNRIIPISIILKNVLNVIVVSYLKGHTASGENILSLDNFVISKTLLL